MKIYHFTLIFAFFAVIMCAVVSWRVSEENFVSTDNSANEKIFDDAVDAATAVLMKTEDGNLSIDKEAAVEAFFTSMFASLGIVDMPMEMTELEMYVPVIAVTCDDGLYICHNEILPDKDGDFEINRTWTDKIPYSYDDGYFIYRFTNGNTVTVYDYNCYLAATPDVYKADPTQISEFDHFVEVVANIPSAAWPVCLLTNETLFEEIRVKVISETMEEYLNYYCNEHNMIAQHDSPAEGYHV